MPHYRVHILDSSGKLIGAGQFDCVNGEIAQERVKQLAGDLDRELGSSSRSSGGTLSPAQGPDRARREFEGVFVPERGRDAR
jgi:hypothetical protein